jgi:FkbM family methyltransferase
MSTDHPLSEHDVAGIGRVYTRDGTSDGAVFDQIFKTGLLDVTYAKQYAWIKTKYDRAISTGGSTLIVDCGSNIGLSCLFFTRAFPKATIVGIEPAPDNVAIAKKNTSRFANIQLIEAAVHDRSGRLALKDPRAEKWAYQYGEPDRAVDATVEAVTIDDLMAKHGAKRNLIVKVDIEGGEYQLFRSNLAWLDRTDLLIIETHDWLFPGKGTSSTLFQALAGRKFEVLQSTENMFFFFTE